MSPVALISLLLAGRLRVSTQQVVTPAVKTAQDAAKLLAACWFWLAASATAALLAWLGGAAQRPIAVAAALAMSPALAGFLAAPKLAAPSYAGALIGAWFGAAGALVAISGGAASPLVVLLSFGPLLTAALLRRGVWLSVVGALGCYALAAALARLFSPAELGLFSPALAGAALVLAPVFAWLGPQRGASEASASRVIAEVAHELRTPLTHILGFSEMIERQIYGPIGERYLEYAALIRTSGAHLLEMVNDLLDLSRIDAGRYELKLERFEASEAVAEIVRQFELAAAQKSIALSVQTPGAPLRVSADLRALRRMLFNTIGNAIKFTPAGGRVMVTLSGEGASLVLDTIDNGPGMSEAERARLGQPYERGASGDAIEGAGLGLSLVGALARLQGGALSLHQAPGGGALVRIRLPIIARD